MYVRVQKQCEGLAEDRKAAQVRQLGVMNVKLGRF